MLEYEKIDISDGIDVNKTDKSKECMLSYFWYFIDKNFSYGPYLCNGCYNITQKPVDLKILLLLTLNKWCTEFIFHT